MLRRTFAGALAALPLAVVAVAGAGAQAAEYEWKWQSYWQAGTVNQRAFEEFAEDVKEKSGGVRSFDGFEKGTGSKPDKLIEAKHLADEGRFAKAYRNFTRGVRRDRWYLFERAEKLLEQARAQVKAAEGTGARIEWRVSGKEAAKALKV